MLSEEFSLFIHTLTHSPFLFTQIQNLAFLLTATLVLPAEEPLQHQEDRVCSGWAAAENQEEQSSRVTAPGSAAAH